VVAAYRRHANAVSVLTDGPFFGGSFELLHTVRRSVRQPVLCKDFMLDPYQVVEARVAGADAVLLILSILDDRSYRACAAAAAELRMGVLTEVHTVTEMDRARSLGAQVIGINNRRLSDLSIDLATTEALAPLAPDGALVIAESGIERRGDVVRLRSLVDGFLIGSTLMTAPDPDRAIRDLIFGPTKVCGLTRPEDAEAARAAGATHGGMIFAAESPRRVEVDAAALVRAAPDGLSWVGVYLDQPIGTVADQARALELSAVQLHGSEDEAYLAALRNRLPAGMEVWRAVRVRDRIPAPRAVTADRVVLDGYRAGTAGGTGTRFDWSLIDDLEKPDRYLLGGGLDPTNAAAAERTGIHFLDVNSGVEQSPGRKDPARLAAFFEARRNGSRVRP
jgi:indole-3-glycerol phosphate synthase/phosphoribosylanthranilate isomerase